jgi:hypothetical protein
MKLIILTKGTKNVTNITNLFIISGFIFYRLPTNLTVKIVGVIKPNGTAVEGVCVTGAAIRVLVLFVSSEAVPVARQYGAIFAITVRGGFITIAVQVVC